MSPGEVIYENKATNTVKTIKMSVQTILLRITVLLAMVAAVLTVLYFTPMPEHNFVTCERPCHELEWPMICRITLTVEMYKTMTSSCNSCFENNTLLSNCNNSNCILGNGIQPRSVITANRQLPGPPIQVCQNDILVIDVVNKIPGESISIHWRGQTQVETPFMDGVPMITQCPISSYTTFQYKFRASIPGTHLWEGYSGMTLTNGLFGALVVRQPKKLNRFLYDYDEHVIMVSTWNKQFIMKHIYDDDTEDFDSILFNGKTYFETTLQPHKRYRFRMAYASGSNTCPIKISIENHNLKIIAIDAHTVAPTIVNSFTLSRGERVDFVLLTDNVNGGDFRISAETVDCENSGIVTQGVIRYKSGNLESARLDSNRSLVLNNFCENIQSDVECVDTIKSYDKLPIVLRDHDVKKKIFLSFNGNSTKHEIGLMEMNNFTFMFPSSPMLSQWNDVVVKICNEKNIPKDCQVSSTFSKGSQSCECTYLEKIALGDTVELIISDQGGDLDQHVFHLHGYSFYVVGARQFPTTIPIDDLKELEERDMLLNRNLLNPLQKDTITIPRNGVVALRFKADNPGYWILRQEHNSQWTKGADVILQVGELKDFVPVPFEYPTCGNYVGPTFFLA